MSTFLLGKSGDVLTGFEAISQDSKYTSFQNTDRTVDKSLTAYQFREKGEWSYGLSYIDNSTYQDLFGIIKNRSSLQEGMILLPQPYCENVTTQNACIITPTYNTDNKAYWVWTVFSNPWDNALSALNKTELDSTNYGYIGANDSSASSVALPIVHSAALFKFKLTDFFSSFSEKELRRLTLAVLGMNSAPIRFFIWSPTYEQWYNIDDRDYYDHGQFDSSAFSLNKQLIASFTLPWGITSMADHFVDDNDFVHIMYCPSTAGTQLTCQYVRLFVNGYWVLASDPQDFENFSSSFTGAGRSGNLKLLEM